MLDKNGLSRLKAILEMFWRAPPQAGCGEMPGLSADRIQIAVEAEAAPEAKAAPALEVRASPEARAAPAPEARASPAPAARAVPAAEPAGHRCPAEDTVVTMTQLVLPSDSSQQGTLLAGPLLKWIDICACMSAERFSGTHCVTASMEDIHFRSPVRVGEVVKLMARVHQAWTTSMEVGVTVTIERLGERASDPEVCCHAMSTFVCKDKKSLPALVFTVEEQRERAEEANGRKALRQKMPKKNDQDARPAIAEGTTVSTELVMPHHCQHMGTTFGGWVMQWMECTASIAAARHTRLPMVCTSTDTVNFLAPSYAGEAIEFRAIVTCVWNTSLEVGCWASAENLREGTSKPICQMYATYISSGDTHVALPKMALAGGQADRTAEAYQRRMARLQRKALHHSGGLSVDAAAFNEQAARRAVRDLQALAGTRGQDARTSEAGEEAAGVSGWETVIDGVTYDLPVVVDVLDEYPITCVRIAFSLGAPPERVHDAVTDFRERRSWDRVVADVEPLPTPGADAGPSTGSFLHEAPVLVDMMRLSLRTGHDVTVARARMADKASSTYYSVSRSVRHPDAPPTSEAKRIEVLPSGWLLRPDGKGGCKAIYTLQLGTRALGMMLSSTQGAMLSSKDLTAIFLKTKETSLEPSAGMLPETIRAVKALMDKFPPRQA